MHVYTISQSVDQSINHSKDSHTWYSCICNDRIRDS